MSVKDYTTWHQQKAALQAAGVKGRYFYEREVWWTAIGCNIGFEEDGKWFEFSRPVLILRKFNAYFFLGVPLSSTNKTGQHYHRFEASPFYTTALLSQVRAFDAKRLLRKDGSINTSDHAIIKLKLITILAK